MFKRIILAATIAALAAPAAHASTQHWVPVTPVARAAAPPACPAGMPVQDVHVINQANVLPERLALVERAAVDQSLQLRRWWNTPCVRFADDGWNLYLKKGPFQSTQGVHFYNGSTYMLVWTGALNYEMWSHLFTHEITETLVDPLTNRGFMLNDANGARIEVADPVEWTTYRLDGVNVNDFVTPAWYAGAREGACATTLDGIECDGPLVAAADSPGPYDQAGVLQHPWQLGPGVDPADVA